MANRSGVRVPDLYAKLGISADCSHEQVVKAANEMRVKMHPDRRADQWAVGGRDDED